jgi:hypothetical protein
VVSLANGLSLSVRVGIIRQSCYNLILSIFVNIWLNVGPIDLKSSAFERELNTTKMGTFIYM